MKYLFAVMGIVLPLSAHADYFGCELRVNDDLRAVDEAPYRGREVKVSVGSYSCEAVFDQNVIVTTNVTNLLSGTWAQAGGHASAAVQIESNNPSTDSHELVFCKCGLN